MKIAPIIGWLYLAVILMTGSYNNRVWPLCSGQSRMPAVAWSSISQQAASFARDSLATLLDEANDQWVESYNRQKGDVGKHYLEKAVFFPERSGLIQGNQAITKYYTQHYPAISTIQSVRSLRRFVERPGLVVYEIGEFTTVRPATYAYLIVWKKSKGAWYRELEAIAERTTTFTDVDGLEQAREKWMHLCNAHVPRQLVENEYTKDAYYYNQGRITQGWDKITTEYGYMAQPGYSLHLNPVTVLALQSGLVYEIGKCSGSYGGHYILRWEKLPGEPWKVSLDSNY